MTTVDDTRQRTRLVRLALVSCALVLVPAVSVVEQVVGPVVASADASGVDLCGAAPCDAEMSPATAGLVDSLSASGLACRPTPSRADTVVVEWGDGSAEAVPFERALSVAAHREGWLWSFCVGGAPGR